MPNLDESELLERRLADRIVDRVRPALFRYYAAAGTAVIAVLGLIGWNIIADLKDRARSVTEQAIKPVIDDANLRLSKHATEVEKQLSISEWLSSRARASAEKVDVQLEQLGPKAKLLEEIGSRLSEIEQRRRELEENIKRASIQANGTVEISRQVADLALQVEGLSQRLESLSAGPRANTPAVTTAQAAIKNIAGAAESTHAKVVMASSEPTVWLQFAGGTRAQAEELSQALAAKRYIIPAKSERPIPAKSERPVQQAGEKFATSIRMTWRRRRGLSPT